MKIVWNAFKQTAREIWSDVMLTVILIVPILMGVAFHFLYHTWTPITVADGTIIRF